MNSKVVRQSIFVSVVMILAMVSIVVIANWDRIQRTFVKKEAVISVTADETTDKQIGNNLSGFLSDESFFDEEEDYSDVVVRHGTPVSLVTSSVAQDLQIMIVDRVGELKKGASFQVDIENVGIYEDEDQDGIIYVNHLRPGKYYISLQPLDGYLVENTKLMIQIKDKIDYQVLDSVAYRILSENDIDTTNEDLQAKNANAVAKETNQTEMEGYTPQGKLGIDVSRWNGYVEWSKVAESGIQFAIVRCGYRGAESGDLIEDSSFRENMKDAQLAGIELGAYFYTQAITEVEAIEEASAAVELCKQYHLSYPIYIDTESFHGKGRADDLTKEQRTAICKAFCQTVESAGYEAGVYASRNWMENQLNMKELNEYSVWLAEYQKDPSYRGSYELWQYTSSGSIDGIERKVDLNISYR